MSPTPDVPLPDRRHFLMLMGLACATTAFQPPTTALAQTPTLPPPSETPGQRKQASLEAQALVQVLKVRYDDHLTAAQLGAIAIDLDVRLEGGRELRQLKLANDDEPDATFHA